MLEPLLVVLIVLLALILMGGLFAAIMYCFLERHWVILTVLMFLTLVLLTTGTIGLAAL